ncbi:hypothetical protein DT385_01080 [Pseudomonas syringae]|nr:hypothetical protein DT385_01080 [Pseudomonas syringae]
MHYFLSRGGADLNFTHCGQHDPLPKCFYSVEDTWANYDKLSPVIDARFAEWQAMGKPEYVV